MMVKMNCRQTFRCVDLNGEKTLRIPTDGAGRRAEQVERELDTHANAGALRVPGQQRRSGSRQLNRVVAGGLRRRGVQAGGDQRGAYRLVGSELQYIHMVV